MAEPASYAGKRITVMGLGRFGGGIGAVRFLVERGAQVTVTDLRSAGELADSIATLEATPPAAWTLGGHTERDFVQADLVVVNPAVPSDSPFLEIALRHGVPLTSEIRLFWEHNRGRVIGVTGSNGKSTTASLIHSLLAATGRPCWLGGNIGRSLLSDLEDIQQDDWVVLELSSFQLEDLNHILASPQIAVVTNFRPNHLDRHGTVDQYRQAKQTILRWQNPEDVAVLNRDDADVARWKTMGRRVWFSLNEANEEGVFPEEEMARVRLDGADVLIPLGPASRLPGRHNRENQLAAIAAAMAAGCDSDAAARGLRNFRPLPHRLQLVAQAQGRAFYNDSKATTPEAALCALEAFHQPVILLAGGYDKHIDLTPLARGIASRAKAAALMGQTARPLATAISQAVGTASIPLCACRSLAEAFQWAVDQSAPGDVVVLSPGCASYDWFRDYEERGTRFTELAAGWVASFAARPASVSPQ